MRTSVFLLFSILFLSCSGYQDYKGDKLLISKGNSSSVKMSADTYKGYEWIVASNSDPSVAVFEEKENVYGEKNTDMTEQILKFKGLKKGKTIITLNYIKHGDFIAKKTRTINISVY